MLNYKSMLMTERSDGERNEISFQYLRSLCIDKFLTASRALGP